MISWKNIPGIAIIVLLGLLIGCDEASETSDKGADWMRTEVDTKDSLAISGVKTIPAEVFERTELKYLSVWGMDCDFEPIECLAIEELPAAIGQLKNLEELHLGLNYIRTLPPEILQLKKLKHLDLTENPGFTGVETVSKMTWLKNFSCFGCHLTEEQRAELKAALPDCVFGFE